MNLMSRGTRIVLAVTALALPMKATGCGRSACITVTQAQLLNGSCPSRQTAQSRFSGPDCPGSVTSVDSDGTLDGNLCCYAVTTDDNGETSCGEGGSSGDVFEGEEESSSTGFGGSTGACGTCQEVLNGAPFNSTMMCSDSLAALQALQTCACNGTCMAACDPNLCISNAPDVGCLSCLQASCTGQLTTCHQD
jgi:hypothetical protein